MPIEENQSREQKAAEAKVEGFQGDLGPFVGKRQFGGVLAR
jgi:hypothetical protein